jgi:hypothetical protein
LREFLKLRLELTVLLNALFGRLPLDGQFEEELVDLSRSEALGQIIKGAVFISTVMAVAMGLAAAGEAFDQRGAQAVGRDLDLREQETFAFAQVDLLVS